MRPSKKSSSRYIKRENTIITSKEPSIASVLFSTPCLPSDANR